MVWWNPDSGDIININVTVVNYGMVDVSNIEVRFYDEKTLIGVNNSIANLPRDGQPNDNVTVGINWTTSFLGRHMISAKIVPKPEETNLANNYISEKLIIGFGINLDFTKPNLVVKKFSISKDTIKSKETVVLTATIANTARITSTGFTLRWGSLFEGTNTTLNSTVYVGNVTYVKDVELRYEWTPAKGGFHIIWVNIENVQPDGEDVRADADPEIDGDYAEIEVDVLPKILLVDDDLAGKESPKDTVTHMREALSAIGVTPDVVTVGAGDGPQYTGTGITLDDYDVVIWITGYETTNTLTIAGSTADVSNLQDYLDNNGSLWLIGQDIVNDLVDNGGAAGASFLSNYLHVGGQTMDVDITNQVRGNDNCDVTAGLQFNTSIPVGLSATPDLISPVNSISAMDNATNGNLSLLHNRTNYQVAFFAFDFSHIKGHGDRAILAYKILEWFNATVTFEGDDLSVSEVIITPRNPYYKQEVTINAVIRNNGMNDLNQVRLIFRDVFQGIETVIPTDPRDMAGGVAATDNPMTLNITSYGGVNVTLKHWVPDRIGMHQIKVVVDPNDVIKEIDETNNEFVSTLAPTDVFVDSITLVVDDDQSVAGATNATASVIDIMDFLNYRYEQHNVTAAGDDGPDLDTLTKYNSVVWVLGNESTTGTTLTANAMTNIDSYLTGYQGNLLILGQNLLEDDGVRNNLTFRRDLLGINGYTRDVSTPDPLLGVKDNNVTHGMRFDTTTTFGDEADTLTPHTGAEALFLNSAGSPFAIAHHNTSGVDYKVAVLGFEYSFITDPEDRNELAYMMFHWFGQADYRIELRVTWEDMYFGRDNGPPMPFDVVNPVLGDSYIIQAKIWNAGNTPAGAVIRFIDGTTVINSASVYVPASTVNSDGTLQLGSEIAEIIWTPLFAGDRPITVKIDPDMNLPLSLDPRTAAGEVMKQNNNMTRGILVYFFFDDMEQGANTWDHDATILNINGEQPVEYFDRLRPVDTNIVSDMDWGNSMNWSKQVNDGRSQPSSFKMDEPLNQNLSQSFNLKVAMCIDDSGSMGWNDPTYFRTLAAYYFLNGTLKEGDQLTIYRFGTSVRNLYQFQYGGGFLYEEYPFENMSTYLTTSPNASAFNNNHGMTRFYSCMDDAVNAMNAWSEPNMFPVVIALTDGSSNRGISFANYMPRARGSGVPIYTIGLGGGVVTRELYDTAEISNGGKYYFAASADVLNDTFSRIASDIGGGGSRSLSDQPNDDEPPLENGGGSGAESRASSRQVRVLYILNPVGGEKWGNSVARNITWACRSDTQANCGRARIQISIDGAGWTNIVNNAGTRLDYPGYHQRIWYKSAWPGIAWYPRNSGGWIEVFNWNWTVPDVASNNVRLRVCVTDGGRQTCSSTTAFETFDMGITFGSGGAGETSYYLTTEAVRLDNYEKATLKFWQRYDLLYTENGGVMMVGTSPTENGAYLYEYAEPTQPYSGNLRLDKAVTDDLGNDIRWAWNGRSGGGNYEWEFMQVDLGPYLDPARPWVKVRFMFYTWGFGNGGGWQVDDVKINVRRGDLTAITPNMADQWEYYEWTGGVDPAAFQPHSGTHMWWNHNPAAAHDLNSGIDNSLYSKSIDLTNAKDAHLSTNFMFNYDDAAGRPPDGFRTEVSDDNGVTWRPINLGVRSSWGVSGDWNTDGKSPDGTQAYTGIQDNGVDSNTPVWVEAGTLWRLETNLSGWAGSVIKLRFRVVTNLDPTHFDAGTQFRGFAVDDVIVRGNTTMSRALMPPPGPLPDETMGPGNHGVSFDHDMRVTGKLTSSNTKLAEVDLGDDR